MSVFVFAFICVIEGFLALSTVIAPVIIVAAIIVFCALCMGGNGR